MTESRRKQLHLGKCIEDLDKMHNVPDLKTKRVTVLCKSAVKLFENAEEFREKGDEEYAYVYYMKFLRVVAYLSKEKEYLKDKTYYTSMIGAKNPNKALDAAEKLKKSLIDRYAVIQNSLRVELSQLTEIPETVTTMESASISLPGLDEVTIKCEQLYPILKARQMKVMILDCRPGKDYTESHINYPTCISVPEECISPGQSANVLEQNLPASSRRVWADRANVELIVMVDWSSTKVIPGTTLFLLKTILLKWDVKVQYSRVPLALRGGYEDWLLKYPALATNPQVVPPAQAVFMDDMLGDIEYPNWSDLMPPPPAPPPAPAAPPPARAPKPGEPVVDRSSKAAAVQVYEERARSMQQILEQQERIADTSLTLEMQRIEAEQDWGRVREKRECEVRDELRAIYKLREHEINSQLMQLENKQYDMELENQRLRDKLEEYQRREREATERLAIAARQGVDEAERMLADSMVSNRELKAKRARIAAVTEQRARLDLRREQLEAERRRKLDDARRRHKPNLDKDEDGDTYMSSPGEEPAATGLNRSVSSPHLANRPAGSDEDDAKVPTFDRSTKPQEAPTTDSLRASNFEPYLEKVGPGLTGLKNLGNTCYMNSILQCLSNTAMLNRYFEYGQYRKHLNRCNSTRGAVAEQFAAVVCALWSGQCRHIAAKDLRNEVGKHQRAFRGCEQQDSHEFLTIFIDWLHLDLQTSTKPAPRDSLTPSDKAWNEFAKGKESIISRLFYGQIRSTVRCTVCGKTSVTYDSFSNLSLELPADSSYCTLEIRSRKCRRTAVTYNSFSNWPLEPPPESDGCTLEDCLKLYLKSETIPGWNCPACKEKRDAVKKLDISRRPQVLVIHFKRFYADKECFKKKPTYIEFPVESLDLAPFSLQGGEAGARYALYAVSNHYGSLQAGHYTAVCKSAAYDKDKKNKKLQKVANKSKSPSIEEPELSRWYKYDDHMVTEITLDDVKSSAAYILFYAGQT